SSLQRTNIALNSVAVGPERCRRAQHRLIDFTADILKIADDVVDIVTHMKYIIPSRDIGNDVLAERMNHARIVGNICVRQGGSEVYIAVEHHRANTLGEQARIPETQPCAIRCAEIMQLFVAKKMTHEIHVPCRGVGIDVIDDRILLTAARAVTCPVIDALNILGSVSPAGIVYWVYQLVSITFDSSAGPD